MNPVGIAFEDEIDDSEAKALNRLSYHVSIKVVYVSSASHRFDAGHNKKDANRILRNRVIDA